MLKHLGRIMVWSLVTTLAAGLGVLAGFLFMFFWVWSQIDGGEPFPIPRLLNELIGGFVPIVLASFAYSVGQLFGFKYLLGSRRPRTTNWILATTLAFIAWGGGILYGAHWVRIELHVDVRTAGAAIVTLFVTTAGIQWLATRGSFPAARIWMAATAFGSVIAAMAAPFAAIPVLVLLGFSPSLSSSDGVQVLAIVAFAMVAVLQGLALELFAFGRADFFTAGREQLPSSGH